MNELLFLECSPFGEESLGALQVLTVLSDCASRNHPIRVSTRNLAVKPLPPLSAPYSKALAASAPADDPAFALSDCLIRELEVCDGLLISTPMHNFAVPATLKLWIDYVLRKGRTFMVTQDGKAGLLRDRPTLALVRSGSPCVGEAVKQPDFLSPYLRHALSVIGIHNVQFVYLPGLPPAASALALASRALSSFLDSSLRNGNQP